MKNLFISIIFALLFVTTLFAQTSPKGLNYQAIARDLDGEIMAQQTLELKINLLSETIPVYTEVHTVLTSEFGLFSLLVGNGTDPNGDFNTIPWSSGDIWIEVEIKNQDDTFEIISSSKLYTVPYAFHSNTASKISTPPGELDASWLTTGNANTNKDENFIGTTDDEDLIIRRNNISFMRFLKYNDNDGIEGNLSVNFGGFNHYGQVVINTELDSTDQDEYLSYPLIVSGSNQGIGIEINGDKPSRDQNYITFFNENQEALGRIEGSKFDLDIVIEILQAILRNDDGITIHLNGVGIPYSFNSPNDLRDLRNTYFNNSNSKGILKSVIEIVLQAYKIRTSIGVGPGTLGVWGEIDDIIWDVVDLAWMIYDYKALRNNALFKGVAFESGGADYAEWLKKAYPDEQLLFGEVVGVKGSLISKTFTDANQFLAVTSNPIIVGGMPEKGSENGFEKVALMGQVPIKVFGEVVMGDYILPSGYADGYGIAVNPKNMKANDFSKIIGVAWSESNDKGLYNYINTAVGFNTNQMGMVVNDMQLVINMMQEELVKLNPEYKPVYFDSANKNIQNIEENNNELEAMMAYCPDCPAFGRGTIRCYIECWINNSQIGNVDSNFNAINKIVRRKIGGNSIMGVQISVVLEIIKKFAKDKIMPMLDDFKAKIFIDYPANGDTGIINISDFDDFPKIQDLLTAVKDGNYEDIADSTNLQEALGDKIEEFKETLEILRALQDDDD